MKINNLLRESTTTGANTNGRPDLVALTRAAQALIFEDLVAIQATSQPEATIFGMKYNNPNKEMTALSPATFMGEVTEFDRLSIPDVEDKAYAVGDRFKVDGVVYEVTVADPFTGSAETDVKAKALEAIIAGTVRFLSDAANTTKYENPEEKISEANFRLDRWNASVKTRKVKTQMTVELAQDMEGNQQDAVNTIDDMLSTVIAGEVNKDIIQKLITVSSRYKVQGVTDKGVLDLSDLDLIAPDTARKLYFFVCEMANSILRETTFAPTFVLASTRVCAMLQAAGWVEAPEEDELHQGTLKNGLKLYADTTSPVDYAIVGVKRTFNDLERVGSLFLSPYEEADDLGAFKVAVDPQSLQPTIMLMLRYALSINPYTLGVGDDESRLIQGDDWNKLVGLSKMSHILGVKLPPLAK